MTPIKARSRRPTTVEVSMLSIRRRACSSFSTGVLPRRTTYFGPRTAYAGLTASTWPTTSQSNSMRTAARCCLTVGLAAVSCSASVSTSDDDGLFEPREERARGPIVGHAGILVADGGGKEFEEAAR